MWANSIDKKIDNILIKKIYIYFYIYIAYIDTHIYIAYIDKKNFILVTIPIVNKYINFTWDLNNQ